ILGHRVVPTDYFVELLDGTLVIPQFIMAVTQQVIIGIVELSTFAPVLLQMRNGLPITFQVEITFPYDLVEFGDLLPVGAWQLFFGDVNGLFKITEFKVQVRLVIGKLFIEQLGVGDLVKTGTGLVVIILFVGNVPQIVLGLGTVFRGGGHLVEIGFGLGRPFGSVKRIADVEIVPVPLGKGHGGIVHFFVPLQGQ